MDSVNIGHLIEAAKAGGEILNRLFRQSVTMVEKSRASDVRTQADSESEDAIIKVLNAHFPDFNILTEEEGSVDRGSDYSFHIDPMDGTNNFVLGIPNFTVSIGLTYKKEAIAGVVYQPLLGVVYSAQKGQGAYLNGQRIHVNSVDSLAQSTVSYSSTYGVHIGLYAFLAQGLAEKGIKRMIKLWSGAFEHCLLAEGRIEVLINNNPFAYDFIAGKVIALEAGAKIANYDGSSDADIHNGKYVISNGTKVHDEIVDLIKQFEAVKKP